MNKYVSPIIEIEDVEVEDIMDVSTGDNELGGATGGGGFKPVVNPNQPGDDDDDGGNSGGNTQLPIIPNNFSTSYFN